MKALRVGLTITAIAAVGTGAACGRVEPKLDGCVQAAPDVVNRLQERVTAEGNLRNVFLYTEPSSGIVFVSGELHLKEDEEDDKGDILTWATPPGQNTLLAVDEKARKESTLPPASFDVREEGAIRSRGCTFDVLGEVSPTAKG